MIIYPGSSTHREVVFREVERDTGGDNSKRACFGRTTKFLRESGDWEIFLEIRTYFWDIAGLKSEVWRIYATVSEKYGRIFQLSGMT